MCGICGKLNFDLARPVKGDLVYRMLDQIRHRGPDDEGTYARPGLVLGHRRLSIIDLSTGHQPLSNEDGSIWIVFNGEIYNYLELREFLIGRGHTFQTRTDTETIVHLYEELGPACVEKLRGMFAFAIWDEKGQTLFMARDRMGIKPLYYYCGDNSVVFGSEIKAVLADPEVPCEIAPEIIDRFLTFLYLPGEQTLLKGVLKLPPGSYLLAQKGNITVRQYWDLEFPHEPRRLGVAQAEEELEVLLSEVVQMHMIADVPVGVLLSGGVDSTAVLSFAAENTSREIHSYTIGFADSAVADERYYARIAAQTFGSPHHDMTITADQFADFLPKYVWHMEEPVCEPPAVAMFYVSQLAAQQVKVLLSGEGGDEAFAGYSNYRNLLWLERLKRVMPSMNGVASKGLAAGGAWLHSPAMKKYAPLVDAQFPDYYYSRTSNPFRNSGNGLGNLYAADYAASVDRPRTLWPVHRLQAHMHGRNPLDTMLYIDSKTWLPDDLLIKADKMTMANSLELRVPLLDHRLLEFAASLPGNLKVRGFTTKYIAKRTLRKRIPQVIVDRPKVGFPVPYESWLRHEMREFVHDILLDPTTTSRGYFDTHSVRRLLERNDADGGHAKEVFSLVALELWHRTFLQERHLVVQ
jgi:asparagine synthase (glutamine-hydrolysing)